MNDFLARGVSAWTLPGGIVCNSKEDQDRLEGFLTKFPQLVDALAQRIATAPPAANDSKSPDTSSAPAAATGLHFPSEAVRRTAEESNTIVSAPTTMPIRLLESTTAVDTGAPHRQHSALPPHRWPKHPKRFSEACSAYFTYQATTLMSQSKRTSGDKEQLLTQFLEFLQAKHPELGEDPWVHDLDSLHVSEFLKVRAKRTGKRKNADGEAMPLTPLTMLKTLNDLRHFFKYQQRTAKSTTERIADDFEDEAKA